MTHADCRRPLFACRMIYRSSPAVVVLGWPPPTFLTAVPVVWNAFQARETTLLLIPNSAATLVTKSPLRNWEFLYEPLLTGCGEIPLVGSVKKFPTSQKFSKRINFEAAPDPGPIREIILDRAKSSAPGFWSDEERDDKKGDAENSDREILSQSCRKNLRLKKLRRNSTRTGRPPCPSPLHLLSLKLSFNHFLIVYVEARRRRKVIIWKKNVRLRKYEVANRSCNDVKQGWTLSRSPSTGGPLRHFGVTAFTKT
ncbi:hypothetical protein TNCV_3501601 [Trichonephila clavipes]|uniref:Uncharacterized protein n=1 Tax=Trichonephila clavipes TaxID=2585209 RepID=A0A8X6S3M6_TRICX|nr:hypothetical protein TNCV_3501601 [Trichonephila clavipes]